MPVNPDGTPIFPIGGSTTGATKTPVDASGQISIWNIPKSIQGQELWFNTGSQPGPVRTGGGDDVGVGAAHVHGAGGRVLATPDTIMKQFAALSFNDPGAYLAVQKELASGPWGTVNPTGSFDTATESALSTAMLQYVKLSAGAGVGISFKDYLTQTAMRAQSLGGVGTSAGGLGGGASAAPTVTLADPAALDSLLQSTARAQLGHELSPEQLSSFVTAFHASQTQQQDQGAGSTTTTPDASAEASSYIAHNFGGQQQGHQAKGYMNALLDMFLPGQDSRAQLNTDPTATS